MCQNKPDDKVDEKQIADNIESLEDESQRIGPDSMQDVMADFEDKSQKDLADD